jgi:hypothetical protein
MRYSRCKEIDQLVRSLVQHHWSYSRGKKHGRLSPPGCTVFVTVPGTPSDWRGLANFRRDLARIAKDQGRTGRLANAIPA